MEDIWPFILGRPQHAPPKLLPNLEKKKILKITKVLCLKSYLNSNM